VKEPFLRPARPDDLEALTAIYNHYVATSTATFDLEPVTVEQRGEWFSHYGSVGPYRLIVSEVEARVRGYASSSRFRPKGAYATSVETTVYIEEGYAGRGLGTRLYAALFDALSGEDLHRAYAGIALPNPASIALHRRFGFAELGVYHEVGRKFGRFWSVQWFEKRLGSDGVSGPR